jgi:hypothetical protein
MIKGVKQTIKKVIKAIKDNDPFYARLLLRKIKILKDIKK